MAVEILSVLETFNGKVDLILDFEKRYSAAISGLVRLAVLLARVSGAWSRLPGGTSRSPFNLLGGEFVGLVPTKRGSPLYINKLITL